jgi:hypothetical protein
MGAFDDIIGNAELPDDTKITYGDKEFTLGEARALNSRLAERESAYQSTVTERDQLRNEYNKMSQDVTRILGSAAAGADADATRPAADPRDAVRDGLAALLAKDDPTKALYEDKLFGSALRKAEENAYGRARTEIESLQNSVREMGELVKNGFTHLTNAQVTERANRWYDVNRSDIPKGQDGKRMSLREINDFAVNRAIVVPGTQMLDYDRALEVLTEPQRVEAKMTEAEKRGYQKGLEAGRRGAAEVIPIFGDRDGGGAPRDKIVTAGKSQRQIMQEAIARGLADAAAENQ